MGEKTICLNILRGKARVPLILAGPGIAEGAISRTSPSSLYPTCIDFAASSAYNLDGHSLRGLLKDPQTGTWDGQDFSLVLVLQRLK